MRKPAGFSAPKVPVGVLFVKTEDDGGWESDDRRPLRPDLTAQEAADAIRSQLSSKGMLDVDELIGELS